MSAMLAAVGASVQVLPKMRYCVLTSPRACFAIHQCALQRGLGLRENYSNTQATRNQNYQTAHPILNDVTS